jgi:hypothetical protein
MKYIHANETSSDAVEDGDLQVSGPPASKLLTQTPFHLSIDFVKSTETLLSFRKYIHFSWVRRILIFSVTSQI